METTAAFHNEATEPGLWQTQGHPEADWEPYVVCKVGPWCGSGEWFGPIAPLTQGEETQLSDYSIEQIVPAGSPCHPRFEYWEACWNREAVTAKWTVYEVEEGPPGEVGK